MNSATEIGKWFCRANHHAGTIDLPGARPIRRCRGVYLPWIWAMVLMAGTICIGGEGMYDPLVLTDAVPAQPIDLTVHDAGRDRDIPIRVFLPAKTVPAPVVVFSHGLGGNRKGSNYLGEHWSGRGYTVVFVQHPGSDDSVWHDKPIPDRMTAMNQAANGKNFMLRVRDIPAVLDRLQSWQNESGHPFAGRLDLAHIGMSGHSFGAVTTQAVSGQAIIWGQTLFTDPRIRAAIAFSPSCPRAGTPEMAFGSVKIPWMLMTGTEDNAPIGNADPESRLRIFPCLPPGDKYELVLDGAEHSAFADRSLPGEQHLHNPNHHRAVLALSTAFWDAYLGANPAAKAWLESAEVRRVLEEKDRWQFK